MPEVAEETVAPPASVPASVAPIVTEKERRVLPTRERKTVDLTTWMPPKKAKFVIPEGKGDNLGEIPSVVAFVAKQKSDDLRIWHKALFGLPGVKKDIKSNLRSYSGFPTDEAEEKRVAGRLRRTLEGTTLPLCRAVVKEFNLVVQREEVGGKQKPLSKGDYVELLFHFFKEPRAEKTQGVPQPRPKKVKKPTGGKRKRKPATKPKPAPKPKAEPAAEGEDVEGKKEEDAGEPKPAKKAAPRKRKAPAAKEKPSAKRAKKAAPNKDAVEDAAGVVTEAALRRSMTRVLLSKGDEVMEITPGQFRGAVAADLGCDPSELQEFKAVMLKRIGDWLLDQ